MIRFIPILFSTPMVHAIMDGRKTMTRRIMKPQLKDCSEFHKMADDICEWKNEPIKLIADRNNANEYYCEYCGNGIMQNGKSFGKEFKAWVDYKNEGLYTSDAIDSFRSLWESISGEESWKQNPFVWAISFERTEKPENFLK